MLASPRIVYVQSAVATAASLVKPADSFCREMQNRGLDPVILQLVTSAAAGELTQVRQQLRYYSLVLQQPCQDLAVVSANTSLAVEYFQVLQPQLVVVNQLDATTAPVLLAAKQLQLSLVLDLTAVSDPAKQVTTELARALLAGCDQVWVSSAKQRQALLKAKVPGQQVHAIPVLWQEGAIRYVAASTELSWQLLRQQLAVAAVAPRPDAQQLAAKQLRVAAIMDEFTRGCYEPEARLLHLQPVDIVAQLQQFQPDLFFIESAWKGLNDAWKLKVSNRAPELMLAIAWCRLHRVPVIFWNKEDPVHFSTFLPVAAAVDFVFTTDVDCVPRYKQALGHEQVGLLPFAAQTSQHNPLELFDRKDAFNFAGSYYLRYPERQRDFAALIDTVRQFRPVDIYDRNHENPHPHYQFPQQYKPMILGSLPFEQIDKAYKGYRYGINMNTIKQSQTMFARRVFELLASNTVVVSNYSRGVRTLFGDLVICSDDPGQLQQRLSQVCQDETSYRKFRLLGLRKVMQQHTYRHRLGYICSKVFGSELCHLEPPVQLVGYATTSAEAEQLISNFNRQTYSAKQLTLLCSASLVEKIGTGLPANIQLLTEAAALQTQLLQLQQRDGFFGLFSADDYYGPNYLVDLIHGFNYSTAEVVGKSCYYEFKAGQCRLVGEQLQYQSPARLLLRRSLVTAAQLSAEFVQKVVTERDLMVINSAPAHMLAIDEFNYCADSCAEDLTAIAQQVNDLKLVNHGANLLEQIYPAAELLPAAKKQVDVQYASNHVLTIDAAKMWSLVKAKKQPGVTVELVNDRLKIGSELALGKHCYLYFDKVFNRAELNLVSNSQFMLEVEQVSGDFRTVFEFLDNKNKKLAHSINRDPGEKHALAIPADCVKVRFGFRLEGPVAIVIHRLVSGSVPERPASVLGNSNVLVLAKQYPAYDDLYRYGFLHSRVRAYREQGQLVDIFRLAPELVGSYREFENIDIANGDLALLDATLAQGKYQHVLVHMLDNKMWDVLNKHIEHIRVTVWVHGAEIQAWQRRTFEFENMTAAEVERQKKLCNNRNKFWQSLMTNPHPNLNLVFVSHTFLQEVETDLQMKMPAKHVSVIHNHIDTKIFKYHEKKSEQRLKILSIRSFASRKYANDLTVAAIQLLAKKPYFAELTFLLIGDGALFDAVVEPIRQYSNVKLEQKFVTHYEIARIQQDYGVFLNPTRWDSQGVSRDEAMASGLVPVTTAVAAVPEFVDAASGFVVPAEDAQGLADAIDFLYHHPQDFLRLSKAAVERVNLQCSFEKTITKEMLMLN